MAGAKIAHVVTTFNRGTGVVADISELMPDQRLRGWQPELVFGRHAVPELVAAKRQEGFATHQIPSLRKYVHPLDDLRCLFDLRRLFKEQKFDLVHTHLAKAGVIGRLAAKWAGVKHIVHTFYGASFAPTQPWASYLTYRTLEKWAGKYTDRFIFVSRDLRDAYLREGVCDAAKSAVIYYGKDLGPYLPAATLDPEERRSRRLQAGLDDDTIVLGNVSRIVPWKGHDYAIKALYELKKEVPKVKLMIVGAAKLPSELGHREKLQAQARSLGLAADVIFTGWQDNTPYYYSIFDIYLTTSMPLEGLPLAVMEAYAAGLPVVGFVWNGASDLMGAAAQVVPMQDTAALVRALKREIDRLPESRRQRGKNLAEMIKLQERHTYGRMLAETGALYQELLARQP